MARRRIGLPSDSHTELPGHDRPWVFFMVDCFFLITEFFVLTFKFKVDEAVLPQKLPPGTLIGCPKNPYVPEPLPVHVVKSGPAIVYRCMSRDLSLAELDQMLAEVRQRPAKIIVRVSYQPSVQWGDVMAVFNSCTKARIAECGLVPLRAGEAGP